MDYKQLLRAFLVQAYKIPEPEIDSLINESADETANLNALLGKDSDRINKVKEPFIGKFEQGQQAGTRKAMEDLEKSLKQKYGIEADLKGAELVDAIVTAKAAAADPTKLTEDDIKRHPFYQNQERTFKNQLKETETTWENKLNETLAAQKKGQVFGEVSKKALDIFHSLNPVLDKEPRVAENRKKSFLKDLESFEYDIQADNVVVMKDGKVVDDGHGHSIEFQKLVKDTAANWFEFQQNNGGGNAGNGKPGDNSRPPAGGNYKKPATYEELAALALDSNIPIEARDKMVQEWEAEHSV